MNKRQYKKKLQKEKNKPKVIRSKTIKRTEKEKEILREVAHIQTLGRKANYRLKAIEKLTGSKEHYAGKEFIARLKQLGFNTKSGYIAIGDKFLSSKKIRDLKMLEKLINNFLNTKMSTVKGIKEFNKTLNNSLQERYNFSFDQADKLLRLFSAEGTNNIYKYIDPSDLWIIAQEAEKDGTPSKEKFLRLVKRYYDYTNNLDFKETLEDFYYYLWGNTDEKYDHFSSNITVDDIPRNFM